MPRHRIATVLLLSSAATFASPGHHPPDDAHAKLELLKLRGEMRAVSVEQAKQQIGHFRPLCDAEGYPLVGNVRTKGDEGALQPSELCKFVREQGK